MTGYDTNRIKLPRSRSEAQAASTARRVLERGIRQVGGQFTKPDDDWDPIWLLVGKDWGLFAIPGDIEKYDMVEAVGAMARKLGAIAVGHVNSSWAVMYRDLPPERSAELIRHMETHGGSTEGIPERIEVILLAIHSASRSQTYTIPIERRDDGPPTLGPVERWPSDGSMSGAMVDPIRDGLVKLG